MARKNPPPSKTRDSIDIPDWLRRLPKVELHLHLEGSTDPETLVALSQRHDAQPLTLPDARALYTYKDFQGFMESYKAMSSRLRTPEDYELITYNMVRALAAQGVVHAEVYISFGILYYWHKVEVEPFVEAIERARIRAEAETGTTVLWLIDAVRHFGVDEAARVFRKAAELRAQYPSIVGIGIGGDEARGPASLFKALYAEAAAAGLRLTAHAGESGGPIDGPASIWAAINIGAERIGHGLAAQYDEELLEVLATRQIPIEINVTSNIRTGCCTSYAAHPLRRYFDSGLMVTLNSDDPPMFGANLLDEYILAYEKYGFTLEQLRELAANAAEASFLAPTLKLALLARIEQFR
jgi:adenosine deaminase/aminodeoxyfutalosine deaminase